MSTTARGLFLPIQLLSFTGVRVAHLGLGLGLAPFFELPRILNGHRLANQATPHYLNQSKSRLSISLSPSLPC